LYLNFTLHNFALIAPHTFGSQLSFTLFCFFKFKDIVDVVDGIFQEFSLPTFYKNPSFHVSIAWCLGDICSENTDEIQTKLQDVFDAEVCEKEVARSLVLEVKEVHCKIGNKHFVFPLDAT